MNCCVTLAVGATKEYKKSENFTVKATISQDTKIYLYKEELLEHIIRP